MTRRAIWTAVAAGAVAIARGGTRHACDDVRRAYASSGCCGGEAAVPGADVELSCPSLGVVAGGEGTLDAVRKKWTDDYMRAASARGAPIDWETFNAAMRRNETTYDGRLVLARGADFAAGTLRLRRPCVLRLTEDVTFNPNADAARNWMPACAGERRQVDYCDSEGFALPAFRLGFFAAISIESADVVVDLNGHALGQSEEAALQQRFYANVETAEAPFIPTQGPSKLGFGAAATSCERCSVVNGTLGRSSHHGIHGNGNVMLYVADVTFRDYEVAAVSINGARQSAFVNLDFQGHFTRIPTRATYSQARVLQVFLRDALRATQNEAGQARADLKEKADRLDALMDAARASILREGGAGWFEDDRRDTDVLVAAKKLFRLPPKTFVLPDGRGDVTLHVVDGNAYGMSLSTTGVIIGPTRQSFFEGHASNVPSGSLQSVLIRNVRIQNVLAAINEVPTLRRLEDNKTTVGVAGDVLRIAECMDGETGRYVADALCDAQLSLGRLSDAAGSPEEVSPALVQMRKDGLLGTITLGAELGSWAASETDSLLPSIGSASSPFAYRCNMDSMAHANKGVFGLFIQGADGVLVDGLQVDNVQNGAHLSTTRCGPDQAANGASARGYCAKASRGVHLMNSRVSNVRSHAGAAWGVHLLAETPGASVQNVTVRDVAAENRYTRDPNFVMKSMPFEVGAGVANLTTCLLEAAGR